MFRFLLAPKHHLGAAVPLRCGLSSLAVSRCRSVCIVPDTVLPSSIYPTLTNAIPKMFLSVCHPDLAFVGNAGHLAAVIDLAGSGGLVGPRVNYYIGLLSLNKDSLFADPPEWIAEFMFPRVVLLPNTSRAGGYSSEKAGFSCRSNFHLSSGDLRR